MSNAFPRVEPWFSYEHDKDAAAKSAWAAAAQLYNGQGRIRARRSMNYLALYFGNTSYSLAMYRDGIDPSMAFAPSFNMIQAFTDSLVAMVVRQKVRPFFLTEKGDWEARERAEGQTLAVEATLRDVGMYDDTAFDICFDGTALDGGFTKWTPDYGSERVIGGRIMPWTLLIPEREQILRVPRQYFEVNTIDRGVLRRRFDGDKETQQKIDDCDAAPWDSEFEASDGEGSVADMIQYAECYHLPSGRVDRKDPKAFGMTAGGVRCKPNHDGRRMLVTNNGILLEDDAWPYEYPPYSGYRPFKKPNQFFSRGIPETLFPAQVAVHRMNTRIDAIMNLQARPLLYVWKNAGVNLDKITNAHASMLEGNVPADQAIKLLVNSGVHPDYIRRVESIIQWAKEQVGLSDQTVQANRPPGIDHAPALQMLQDIESIRQHPRFRSWETKYTSDGRCIVDALRLLAERKRAQGRGSLTLIWGSNKHLRKIDWNKCDQDEDKYLITNWPTNLLPQTPGAKLARLVEMAATGILTPQEARFVLASDYPDIEAILGDSNALTKNIQVKLDAVVRGKDPDRAMPHGYLNLSLAKTMVEERINALDADGLPQDKLDKLIQWHEEIVELIARASMGAANDPEAAMASGGMATTGATGATPSGEPTAGPVAGPGEVAA